MGGRGGSRATRAVTGERLTPLGGNLDEADLGGDFCSRRNRSRCERQHEAHGCKRSQRFREPLTERHHGAKPYQPLIGVCSRFVSANWSKSGRSFRWVKSNIATYA